MTLTDQHFVALVLAGERPGRRVVAEAAGVCCKALAPVAGQPMVLRVLNALASSASVDQRILCGLPAEACDSVPQLRDALASGAIQWREGRSTPSASTHAVLSTLGDKQQVLLTTADHALLSADMIDYFCREAQRSSADLVVALASYRSIEAAFPGVRRTVTRLSDDGYCGCNLFAFLTPRARAAADVWRQVEQHRKQPWRLVSLIGWGSVLRYLLGRLSLQQALQRLSRRLGIRISAVIMPYPEASVDVDKVQDWELVNRLAERRKGAV